MFSKQVKIFGFRKNIINFKNFSTISSHQSEIPIEPSVLNSYLKESLTTQHKFKNFKTIHLNIIESINKENSHSMILCDEYVRKNACMLGIMNRIMNSKDVKKSEEEESEEKVEEEFFINTMDSFNKKQEMIEKNLEKRKIKPRGALIICQKFEFATHYYRICRKLDYKNNLKLVRVGTSLHTVAPTVELDVK